MVQGPQRGLRGFSARKTRPGCPHLQLLHKRYSRNKPVTNRLATKENLQTAMPTGSASSAPRSRAKRVSAQHTQERVRNNQRRHRARRRDLIGDLEQKLSDAERTIEALRDQVRKLQEEKAEPCHEVAPVDITSTPLPSGDASDSRGIPSSPRCSCDDTTSRSIADPVTLTSRLDQPDLLWAELLPAMEAHFVPSTRTESTMLCSEAYSIVAQQNFKGISHEEVAGWLWNGFRKSRQPSEGCRVRTDLLFSLLEFISGT